MSAYICGGLNIHIKSMRGIHTFRRVSDHVTNGQWVASDLLNSIQIILLKNYCHIPGSVGAMKVVFMQT